MEIGELIVIILGALAMMFGVPLLVCVYIKYLRKLFDKV